MGTVYKFCNWNSLTSIVRNLHQGRTESWNNRLLLSFITDYHAHKRHANVREFHDFNQLLDASKADEYLFKDDGFVGYYSQSMDIRDMRSTSSATKRSALFKELVHDIFGLTKKETEALYLQYPSLWKKFFYKTFHYLHELGLSKSTFLRYPWLVSLKAEEIEAKLLKVRQAYEDLADISTCTPLMIYSPHIIEGFMERWITEATEFPHPSKVHFMSEAFQISNHEYLAFSEAKPFTLTLPHARLDANVNFMLKIGISRAEIRNDLWVLQYSTKTLEGRAAQLASLNMPAKPYLLRCPNKTFMRVTKRYTEFLQNKNYNMDTVRFMAETLQCDPYTVLAVYRICPSLGNMDNADLKNNLDLLMGRGIPLNKILATPKVLCKNFQLLQHRLDVLDSMNVKDFKIAVLHHNHSKFDAFITSKKEINDSSCM